jgi:hypothetical protein
MEFDWSGPFQPLMESGSWGWWMGEGDDDWGWKVKR